MDEHKTVESYLRLRRRIAFVTVRQRVRRSCDSIGFGPSSGARLCLVLVLASVVFAGFIVISVSFNLTTLAAISLALGVFIAVLSVGAFLVLFGSDAELA